MSSKATIIGKQPLKRFPKFQFENSFGLNQAAITHQTEFGFTGHYNDFQELKEAGVKKIITISPMFENMEVQSFDRILYDTIDSRSPDNSVDSARKYVRAAINGEDIRYPNRLTILHLAMYYVMKKGFRFIELIACANNYDEIPEYGQQAAEEAPIMREYTASIIHAAAEMGVKFNWLKMPSGQLPPSPKPKVYNVDLSILSLHGYFRKHLDLCRVHKTQQDAFDELESDYLFLVKRNRYPSYEAFRTAKSRFYANKNNR